MHMPPTKGTREVLERALAARGMTIHAAVSLGGIEAVKRAIVAGMGIGFVSALAIAMEIEVNRVARINIYDFVVRRPLHLLSIRRKYQTRASGAFQALLKQHVVVS